MAITTAQRNAASLYWTLVLAGDISPMALESSIQQVLSVLNTEQKTLVNTGERMHKNTLLEELTEKDPWWMSRFMNTLDGLLTEADPYSFMLILDYEPQCLLRRAADEAMIPIELFPSGKLMMTFDREGRYIEVGKEKIDAEEFLAAAKKKLQELQKEPTPPTSDAEHDHSTQGASSSANSRSYSL